MSDTRVLVADDSPLARKAIRSLLKRGSSFEVIGEAEDGFEAVTMARALTPDLVLMDINMPRCDGLMATRIIKREGSRATVVILTVSDDATDLFEAVRSGAQGYLLKSLDPDVWLECLEGLVRGEAIPSKIAWRILEEFSGGRPTPEPDIGLTQREQEVLHLVGEAMTNAQIAAALHISDQTVKNHIKNILGKLHLKNRVELALHSQRSADRSSGSSRA
jgi:two-component system, NarL family, nitrate/nitrite response regulator NarL